jgi:ubiquinone/menaquinone biosynthesis C-methylase UbiE
VKITQLNQKTRKILGKIHEGRVKYKKGYLRVTNYLKLNIKKKNFFKDKICGDFGCGNHAGNSKRMLIGGAKFVHLVDLSNKIKPEIRKSLKGFEKKYKFTKGTVEKLKFKNNYFDIVNCAGVIHHTNNGLKPFKEILRVLKKNGSALIVVHGGGGLLTRFTMDIARKEYSKNRLVKKIFDEIMYGKLKKYLPFFKKNLNKSNYKKIETLFQIISDNDLRLTIQDRLLSPKYKLYNYKKLKKYLLSIGFKSVIRTPIKPHFDNIRDLLSPLYGNPDHILSKFLYGDGMLRFVAKK